MSALALDRVEVRFPGASQPTLAGLDLGLNSGEVVAVLGRSGSGKTTLLRLAAGLLAPSAGQVRRPPASVLGYVFQDARLLPWLSVERNLKLVSPKARWPAIPEVLAQVGLAGRERLYPRQLSLGMAQRASVARALLLRPTLLLLDEPHSALDELTAAELRQNLAQVLSQTPTATLLVTHNPAEAVQLADRVVVLAGWPARIRAELQIQLPRPRDPDDPAVWAEVARLRALLRQLGEVAA